MTQHAHEHLHLFEQGSTQCPHKLEDSNASCQSPPEFRYSQGKRGQLTSNILSGA